MTVVGCYFCFSFFGWLWFILNGLQGARVSQQQLQFSLEMMDLSLVLTSDIVFDSHLNKHSEYSIQLVELLDNLKSARLFEFHLHFELED